MVELSEEAIVEIIDMIKVSLGDKKPIFNDEQLKELILKGAYPLWVNLYNGGYRRITEDRVVISKEKILKKFIDNNF